MSIVNLAHCIGELVNDKTETKIPEHVDIMISGGGMGIYYAMGALTYLNELVCQNKICVHNISGASAGAIAAVFFVCCMENKPDSSKEWHGQYNRIRQKVHDEKLGLWDAIQTDLSDILPPNAWELCDKRVYISSLKWTIRGWQTEYFNTFNSNEDILKALAASCNIPFYTTNKLFIDVNGNKYTDGARPHYFNRCHRRHVIYIDLFWLDYSYRKRLSLSDGYIDTVVLKGVLDMYNYCSNQIDAHSLYTYDYSPKGTMHKVKEKIGKVGKIVSLIIS